MIDMSWFDENADADHKLRLELAVQLIQMHPYDPYHQGRKLDADTYYEAIDRAVQLVIGKIKYWTDLKPEGE